jgi:hypothetical protein
MTACTSYKNDEVLTESGLSKSRFQTEINGEKTDLFVLKNKNKMEVCITNYGGRIVSVMVPDKDGIMRDVVLGFDSIQDYIKYPSDFGASIGRYANRINQGRFSLDGIVYQYYIPHYSIFIRNHNRNNTTAIVGDTNFHLIFILQYKQISFLTIYLRLKTTFT